MLSEAQVVKGDLTNCPDEAWNMRKVMWRIYDMAMQHEKEAPDVPGWKMKFVRSKAQVLVFVREGQHKDLKPVLWDLAEKEAMFRGTVFEPYVNAMIMVALAAPSEFKKEGGGHFDA